MSPTTLPIDPRNPPEHIYRVPAYYRKHRPVPRVRIGAAHQPAVRAPRPEWEPPSFWEQAAWFLALGAGFVAFVGLTHMLFGA